MNFQSDSQIEPIKPLFTRSTIPPGFSLFNRDFSIGIPQKLTIINDTKEDNQQDLFNRIYANTPIPEQLNMVDLKSKILLVFRGLPGSGKSFLANYMKNFAKSKGFSASIYSADDYFTDSETKKYEFDGSKIGRAHSQCLTNVIKAFKNSIECIIIDNTNSTCWEYNNYLALADVFGYTHRVLEIVCQGNNTINAFHARTIHEVPLTATISMQQRWEIDSTSLFIVPAYDLGTFPQEHLLVNIPITNNLAINSPTTNSPTTNSPTNKPQKRKKKRTPVSNTNFQTRLQAPQYNLHPQFYQYQQVLNSYQMNRTYKPPFSYQPTSRQ